MGVLKPSFSHSMFNVEIGQGFEMRPIYQVVGKV